MGTTIGRAGASPTTTTGPPVSFPGVERAASAELANNEAEDGSNTVPVLPSDSGSDHDNVPVAGPGVLHLFWSSSRCSSSRMTVRLGRTLSLRLRKDLLEGVNSDEEDADADPDDDAEEL